MKFNPLTLETMIGGVSTLDVPHLNIQTSDQAKDFLLSYGYDVTREDDLNRLWTLHRRAVTYIQSELLHEGEQVPELLTDPNQLKEIWNLLIYASTQSSEIQRWACGILKVLHVYVHLENDLFAQHSTYIQEQILRPIQAHIYEDSVYGTTLGPALGDKSIVLKKFEVKPFKTTSSSITKLLAKPEMNAFAIMDKMGVRFITKHLFDVFRVIRYLVENNIICFAHCIPDQSNNTLYPLNLFFEVVEGLTRDRFYPPEEIDRLLLEKVQRNDNRAEYNEKFNAFTSLDYRFLKFITRSLIRVNFKDGETPKTLSFFYPFEVQIVDYETYLKNLSGPASHERYKERQIKRARLRVLGRE